MNRDQLNILERLLDEEVDNGNAVGEQVAVWHEDKECFYHASGMADREKKQKMARDTICRMYSMTKPVTAVAVSMLRERGLFDVNKKLHYYLPEFTSMKVMDGDGQVISADKDILIRDLLTMTSGLVYPDSDAAGRVMSETFYQIGQKNNISTRELMKKIALNPLCANPGDVWHYGLSADVLAAVLEVITGITIGAFFRDEIFSPLDMQDTGFYVPEDKRGRFAQLYHRVGDQFDIDDTMLHGLTDYTKPPAYESGGAGLVSTIEDYGKFARMLCCRGSLNGRQILKEETVESFAHNMLSPEQIASVYFPQMKGYGYGNLMRVNLSDGAGYHAGAAGEFGWDGWAGPYFTVDLQDQLVILYIVQSGSFDRWDHIFAVRDVAYQALREDTDRK